MISFISRNDLLAKLDKEREDQKPHGGRKHIAAFHPKLKTFFGTKCHNQNCKGVRLPLPILLAASLQTFSCILCTASIHGVAHYWFIYHMQDKVTLDLDLEIMSVRSCDQISAAGKNVLYFNI